MVGFVARAQSLQNLHALLRRWLADRDRLEAALQRGVLFNILAVLGERRRANDPQFAATQRGLNDVRRVHRALSAARADDGVQFVNEQNHAAILDNLVNDAFDALLKLTAVFGTRNHAAQIQRQHALVQQLLRDVRHNDLLGKPFGNGRLADARFTDEHGVVLCTARQNLDGALDLLVAPDYRVELALTRHLGEVAGKFGQSLSLLFILTLLRLVSCRRGGCRAWRLAHETAHIVVELPRVNTGSSKDTHCHIPAVAQNAQKQMLRIDKAAVRAHRLIDRDLHRAARPRGQSLRRIAAGHAAPYGAHDQVAHHALAQSRFRQCAVSDAAAVAQNGQQHMLAADVAVPQLRGSLLSQPQYILPSWGKSFLTHIRTLLSSSCTY